MDYVVGNINSEIASSILLQTIWKDCSKKMMLTKQLKEWQFLQPNSLGLGYMYVHGMQFNQSRSDNR